MVVVVVAKFEKEKVLSVRRKSYGGQGRGGGRVPRIELNSSSIVLTLI